MPLAFVDTDNKFIHRCGESGSLQENCDQFFAGMRRRGMDPCLGNIHLATMTDVKPGEPLLHLTQRDGQSYWELLPIDGLAWRAGLPCPGEVVGNPQWVPLNPIMLAMIAEAIKAQTFDQEGADALIKLIQERTKTP